jgi:hypothetical protein
MLLTGLAGVFPIVLSPLMGIASLFYDRVGCSVPLAGTGLLRGH